MSNGVQQDSTLERVIEEITIDATAWGSTYGKVISANQWQEMQRRYFEERVEKWIEQLRAAL